MFQQMTEISVNIFEIHKSNFLSELRTGCHISYSSNIL